jgi:hypothetical protein
MRPTIASPILKDQQPAGGKQPDEEYSPTIFTGARLRHVWPPSAQELKRDCFFPFYIPVLRREKRFCLGQRKLCVEPAAIS